MPSATPSSRQGIVNPRLRSRPCPICSAIERDSLWTQKFEAVGGVSLLGGYEVVACRVCGHTFADRIPSEDAFARHYAEVSKYEFAHRDGQQHVAEVERLRTLAKWIAESVSPSVRLLDIGCATGELLVALRDLGFSDLTGLDLSETCVRHARDRYGLHVLHGTLDRQHEDLGTFDVAVVSAVLEHVPELNSFIGQIERWLKPDGMLVVEVPDAENFASARNTPYQEFSVEHISYFSAAALENLMGLHGFVRTALRRELCDAGSGVVAPVLTMIFCRGAARVAASRESASEAGVRAYLERCRRSAESENRMLGELVAAQTPILVWGVGTLCQRLLATTRLREANIRAFVDSNPHYQGQEVIGRRVIGPLELKSYQDPIVITSYIFGDEIAKQIREDLGLSNEIIRMSADR